LLWGLAISFIVFAIVAGVTLGLLFTISRNSPDISALEKFEPGETTRIYASNGEVIAELYDENRTWIPLKKIPGHLIDAFIAIEDTGFYEHNGISIRGILRALWSNIRQKTLDQGASTITQQLARNLFLSQERSLKRKVAEIMISLEIERKFTKDEILEMYLNQIFLGGGAFGVEAASLTYFGKPVSDINPGESAILAGLPQAPSVYSPFVDIEACKERQTTVLRRMEELGMITPEDADRYIKEPIKIQPYEEMGFKGFRVPYFSTYCLQELVDRYGSEVVYRSGFDVYTTVDITLQEYAEEAVKKGLDLAEAEYAYCDEGAMVCIENKTGFIRTMVGGYNYTEENQFNRAWQAMRQPGSAFKIFVFTAAIDNGFSPDAVYSDEPVTFTNEDGIPYSPQNSDRKFMGSMTLKDALKLSRNVIAVKLMDELGVENVMEYARAMGIRQEMKPYLSLALGSTDVTVLEMTEVASVLGNMGERITPTTIKKIVDSDGNVIEDNSNRQGVRVIPPTTAYIITDMLKAVIDSGTGGNAYTGFPAAGKTGTTDEYRDAWFVGYTPLYAVAVWVGNDDYSSMERVYGGDYPAIIWGDFMKKAHEGMEVPDFSLPEGEYVEVRICAESGLLAGPQCPETMVKTFAKGSEPVTTCELLHSPTPGSVKVEDDNTETTGDEGDNTGTSEIEGDNTGTSEVEGDNTDTTEVEGDNTETIEVEGVVVEPTESDNTETK